MGVAQVINGSSTAAQRRAIVSAGRRLGMDVDDLRAMTPEGSLRALSFGEASALLDRLNQGARRGTSRAGARRSGDAGRSPRRSGGASAPSEPGIVKLVTPAQREAIEILRRRLAWSSQGLDRFLQVTFGVTVATLARRRDASRVIAVLNKVLDHAVSKERRRRLEAESG